MSICNVADKITEGLYLGNRWAPRSREFLLSHRIEVIISILTENEFRDYAIDREFSKLDIDYGIDWHKVVIDDGEEETIHIHFQTMHTVIHEALAVGKSVLVHCAYGISRSASIVIGFLMLENGWSRKQAIEYVSQRRKIIAPNDGFMDQLKMLELRTI